MTDEDLAAIKRSGYDVLQAATKMSSGADSRIEGSSTDFVCWHRQVFGVPTLDFCGSYSG